MEKDQLVQQQATDLVKASGGTLSLAAARAQAQSDVTGALVAAGADPSQNPGFLPPLLPDETGNLLLWAALGIGGLLLLDAVKR